jgi:hypothetical protein
MIDLLEIQHYLSPTPIAQEGKEEFLPTQIGHHTFFNEYAFGEIHTLDLVIIGCGEHRGHHLSAAFSDGPEKVRRVFYQMHHWHEHIRIGDIGI